MSGEAHAVGAWTCSRLESGGPPDWWQDIISPGWGAVFGDGIALEGMYAQCDYADMIGNPFGRTLRELR